MGSRGPQPKGRACEMDDCEKPHHSRGYCRAHWENWHRGTLIAPGIEAAPVPVDDGVRGPDDLPVPYKTSLTRGDRWAVVLAYPSFDGTQPCAGNEDLYDPKPGADRAEIDKQTLAATLCAKCPFLTPCREWGIAHEEYGFFGGMTIRQRRQLRAKRGQLLATPQVLHMIGFLDRNNDEALDAAAAGYVIHNDEPVDDEWEATA